MALAREKERVHNHALSCRQRDVQHGAGGDGHFVEKEAPGDVCKGVGEKEASRISHGNAIPHSGPAGVWPGAEVQHNQRAIAAHCQEAIDKASCT